MSLGILAPQSYLQPTGAKYQAFTETQNTPPNPLVAANPRRSGVFPSCRAWQMAQFSLSSSPQKKKSVKKDTHFHSATLV